MRCQTEASIFPSGGSSSTSSKTWNDLKSGECSFHLLLTQTSDFFCPAPQPIPFQEAGPHFGPVQQLWRIPMRRVHVANLRNHQASWAELCQKVERPKLLACHYVIREFIMISWFCNTQRTNSESLGLLIILYQPYTFCRYNDFKAIPERLFCGSTWLVFLTSQCDSDVSLIDANF